MLCVIPGLSVLIFDGIIRVRHFGGHLGHAAAVGAVAAAIAAITVHTYGYAGVWNSDATLYPHLIRCNPDDLLARNNHAAWFARHNRHAEAVHIYDKLLERFPEHPKAPLYRAISLSQVQGSTDMQSVTSTEAALSEFNRMLLIEPSRGDLRYYRGGAFARLKRYSEAEADYEAAISSRLASNDEETEPVSDLQGVHDEELGLVWMRYGTLRQEQRRLSEAEHCFRQVLQTVDASASHTRAEAMVNLAAVLTSSAGKQKDEATIAEVAKLYEHAIRAAPRNPTVLINHANRKYDHPQSWCISVQNQRAKLEQ